METSVKLSRRESQVMTGISLGKTNREIAGELEITERTVKFHCANIYAKYGVKSRRALMSMLYFSANVNALPSF